MDHAMNPPSPWPMTMASSSPSDRTSDAASSAPV